MPERTPLTELALQASSSLGILADEPMTPEQTEAFRAEWARLIESGFLDHPRIRLLPPGEALIPLDLEADAHLIWPHDPLAVGDVLEMKREGWPARAFRVTKVIPGPDGQVMYDTEPART